MTLAVQTTINDKLNALIEQIRRHNLTLPYEVQDRLKSIQLSHEKERVTYEQVTSAFKILLSEADDPKAPALIPLLIRRYFLPTQ
jgi:hypothetical protein